MDLRELQDCYLRNERAVTDEKIVPGALILTILSTDDGLVLKNRTSKPKRLIIIGVDRKNNICYGSVLVNTNMNLQATWSQEYLSAQYLLKAVDYPEFLRYDSYADCGELFSIPVSKLYSGEYYGLLNEQDMNGVFDILETTDILSTKERNVLESRDDNLNRIKIHRAASVALFYATMCRFNATSSHGITVSYPSCLTSSKNVS